MTSSRWPCYKIQMYTSDIRIIVHYSTVGLLCYDVMNSPRKEEKRDDTGRRILRGSCWNTWHHQKTILSWKIFATISYVRWSNWWMNFKFFHVIKVYVQAVTIRQMSWCEGRWWSCRWPVNRRRVWWSGKLEQNISEWICNLPIGETEWCWAQYRYITS